MARRNGIKTKKSGRRKAKARVIRRASRIDAKKIAAEVGAAVAAAIKPLQDMSDMRFQRTWETLSKDTPPLFYVGSDLRHTKNLGNYESYVYGFSISGPVPAEPGDDIEKQETRDRLRPKYEASVQFLMEMMDEVRKIIDTAKAGI